MAEEDDSVSDLWSLARTWRSPKRSAKRRALDPSLSQASPTAGWTISQAISASTPAVSQESSAPAPDIFHPAHHKAEEQSHEEGAQSGNWWRRVEVGVDFVPDTQDGGGDEFIFIPNSGVCIHEAHAAARDRARARARGLQAVQQFRRQFPPLPSLVEELRNYVKSRGGKDDKILERCGISTTPSDSMDQPMKNPMRLSSDPSMEDVDDWIVADDDSEAMMDNSESQSSRMWSAAMFKSGRTAPAPCTGPSTASSSPATGAAAMFKSRRAAPAPCTGPSTGWPSPATVAPFRPSAGDMFRSRRPTPGAIHGPPSSSA